MRTRIKLIILFLILFLLGTECESDKKIINVPEGYVRVEVLSSPSIDNCGCNDYIIRTIENKFDTIEIINKIGRITKKSGIIIKTSIICNLPYEIIDTSDHTKYAVVFSGEEHAPYEPIIGPAIYIDSEIVLSQLFIKN
ncbi:MAG: hypothetical protein ACQERS_09795 [Bacteroidota bacterium]